MRRRYQKCAKSWNCHHSLRQIYRYSLPTGIHCSNGTNCCCSRYSTKRAAVHRMLAYVLPALSKLQKKLNDIFDLKYTKPLLDSLLKGISTRFGACFSEKEVLLAAVSYPWFKLAWINNSEMTNDKPTVTGAIERSGTSDDFL